MLLYTGQNHPTIQSMLENGQTYYCTFCEMMNDRSSLSLRYGYLWMMHAMEKHGLKKPAQAQYPIWLTPDVECAKDYSINVLAFDIPDNEVLLSDEGLFGLAAPVCNAYEIDINDCLTIEDDSWVQATTWQLKPEWFKGVISADDDRKEV